jgi:S-formylglutathione hydrolase FrmB
MIYLSTYAPSSHPHFPTQDSLFIATAMTAYTIKSKHRVGAGTYYRITHDSTSTNTPMTFGLFLPSSSIANVEGGEKKSNVPVMYWLSGLTCDDTNFAMKAGPVAFMAAEKEVSWYLFSFTMNYVEP